MTTNSPSAVHVRPSPDGLTMIPVSSSFPASQQQGKIGIRKLSLTSQGFKRKKNFENNINATELQAASSLKKELEWTTRELELERKLTVELRGILSKKTIELKKEREKNLELIKSLSQMKEDLHLERTVFSRRSIVTIPEEQLISKQVIENDEAIVFSCVNQGLKQRISELESKLTERELEHEADMRKIAMLQDENLVLMKNNANVPNTMIECVISLRNLVEDLEMENAKLKISNEKLEEQNVSFEMEKISLQMKLEELNLQTESTKLDFTSKELENQDAIDNLMDCVSKLRNLVEGLEFENSSLRACIPSMESELEKMKLEKLTFERSIRPSNDKAEATKRDYQLV